MPLYEVETTAAADLAPWQKCWRDGFAPALPTAGLVALAAALERDDPAVITGAATEPAPLCCNQAAPCDGADPVAYAATVDPLALTVGEVESAWVRACWDCDRLLGEPAGCRYFLQWVDDTPAADMRRQLLSEVRRALALRDWMEVGTDVDPAEATEPAVAF